MTSASHLLMHEGHAKTERLQRWTTSDALARYCQVSDRSIRNWISWGWLRAHSIQTRHYTDDRPRKTKQAKWRIYEDDLRDFLERMRAGTPLPRGRGFWKGG